MILAEAKMKGMLGISILVAGLAFPNETAAAQEGFYEPLKAVNDQLFYVSDGWGNGPEFGAGWRADHLEFSGGTMALRLDDAGCPSGCSGKTYASAEYATQRNYGYGRVEGRIKAAKGSGLVASLFTYSGSGTGTPNDEIDIEILGKDTTKLETNYFTKGIGGHSTVIDLGFDAASDFHNYAFEWSPTSIRWYVDGRLVHTENGSRGPLPAKPGKIMVNLWPGAGDTEEWTGPFAYDGTPIRAYYDWIKYTPASELPPEPGTGLTPNISTTAILPP